jgi:dienelactone hydrolase
MIREYNRLPEDAQEIQKKINAQQSFDVAMDDPLAEGRMERPVVTPQEQIYLEEQKKIVQQKVEEENRARAEGRAGLVNFVKQKFYEATGTPYSVGFANGGRVLLAKGGKPKDIGRRKFIKGTGMFLAALPFLGKFIKPATKAAPEVL